jgi:hypothetical protein
MISAVELLFLLVYYFLAAILTMMQVTSAFIGTTPIIRTDNVVEFYYSFIASQGHHQHYPLSKSRILLPSSAASSSSSCTSLAAALDEDNEQQHSHRGVHVTVDTVVTAWSTYSHHSNSHVEENSSVNNNKDGIETIRHIMSMATTAASSLSSSTSYLASKKESTSSNSINIDTLSSFIGHRVAENNNNNNNNNNKDNNSNVVTTIDIIHMDTPARQSLPPYLQLRSIPNKGLGVFSTSNECIPAGTYLGEYTGEILSNDNIKDRRYIPSKEYLRTCEDVAWCASRLDRCQTMTGCYLYGISLPTTTTTSSLSSSLLENKSRIYIDAEDEYYSTWTRFINHAYPPHDNVCPRSIHSSYDGQPRVWFITNRDVYYGDELCFNYGDDYWYDGDTVV